MNTINKKFAFLMKEFRITNYEAAKWLKRSATTISYWRTGIFNMQESSLNLFVEKLRKHFLKLEKALNASI